MSRNSFCQSKFNYGIELSGIQNFYRQTSNEGTRSFLIGDFGSPIMNTSFGFHFRFTYLTENETSVSASPGIRTSKNFNEIDISKHRGTFLDLPFQVNHRLTKNWSMIAGIRLSYLSKFERTDDIYIFTPTRDTNLLPITQNRLFYIPKLGIGVNIIKSLNVEISYNHSLTNMIVITDPFGISGTPTNYKNNFLQLSITYTDLASLFSNRSE